MLEGPLSRTVSALTLPCHSLGACSALNRDANLHSKQSSAGIRRESSTLTSPLHLHL